MTLNIDPGPDADAEELEQVTLQLRDELRELDLESVDLVREGEAPEGAKVVDPITLGGVTLTLAASGASPSRKLQGTFLRSNRHQHLGWQERKWGDRP